MHRLSRIASNEGITLVGPDRDITGITADSRNVKPGYLFIAIPGTKHDGTQFIGEAVANGAAAVLVPEEMSNGKTGVIPSPLAGRARVGLANTSTIGTSPPLIPPASGVETPAVLTTPNVRKAVSAIASTFYPRQPETIVAVTGTSGKTSTAQFTRQIWQAMGMQSASIGTLGLVTAKEERYGSLTTPDAITLHQWLDECAGLGISHLAMEASSHGLTMNRLDHVKIKAGGFTNLSRDHLDYHNTMAEYLAAKLRLFQEVMAPGGTAVLNADIAEFATLAEAATAHGLKVMSYGELGKDIKLLDTKPDSKGQILRTEIFGKAHDIHLPLIGAFQAQNALCALGLVLASGSDTDKAIKAVGSISGVPGRLQWVGSTKNGATVFVDYAHKPDALENVIKALRPHVAAHKGAKLGVVFGCGGNRDKGKRPIMGEIATRLADWVIVTDDNPRHEEPAVIRQEVLAGCKGANFKEIGDRAKAIAAGIGQLQQGDVLIVAGKGHEHGQIVGDVTHPFDDADVARKVLQA